MKAKMHNRLAELEALITRLRGKNGCPWDQKQTAESLKKYLLEETNELAEAIDRADPGQICEEIGDVFFILTLLCEIFREQHLFSIDDALHESIAKMIRRHPHVFADQPTGTEQELREQWEAIKALEHKSTPSRDPSPL